MSKLNFNRIFIGCSGYHYEDWDERFYPKNVAKKDWLSFYAENFTVVELNNTFYQLPKNKKLDDWYKGTPKNFKFVLKGSRYVTHMKKLKDAAEHVPKLTDQARRLKGKLACLLWQLPPNLKKNTERLEQFLKALDNDLNHVVEFRHESWFEKEVFKLLEKHNVGICMISSPEDFAGKTLQTSDIAYLRFHGLDGENPYRYDYSKKELRSWEKKLEKLKGEQVFVFFNNDFEAHAVENAKVFEEMVNG